MAKTIKTMVTKLIHKAKSLLPQLPLKNRRLAITLAAFAVVGITLLIKSFALTPTQPLSFDQLQAKLKALKVGQCGTFDGIGKLCKNANGLFDMIDPKTGKVMGQTHGPDPVPETAAGTAGSETTSSGIVKRIPVCTAATDYHTELIYARAFDDQDDYAAKAPSIRSSFELVNGALDKSAKESGGPGADYKVLCNTDGMPTVHNAVLPTRLANSSFGSIFSDIPKLGYNNSRAKYLVYFEHSFNSYAGMAQIRNDDQLSATNANLSGGMIAVATFLNWDHLMHELSHTMGAVQNSAPHSTKAYHCTDGTDVMCYGDGGSQGGQYTSNVCPYTQPPFDCNYDDYFNFKPAAGSYLATHWNLASAFNTFILFSNRDGERPAAPANLVASIVSNSRTDLSWTAATDNVGVTGYDIYKCSSNCSDSTKFSKLASVASSTTAYSDTGAQTTASSYFIKARDAAGNTSEASGIAVAADLTSPSVPQNLRQTTKTDAKISVSWNASTDNIGVAKYFIYTWNGTNKSTSSATKLTESTSTTFSLDNQFRGTSYNISVRAVDTAGNLSDHSTIVTASTCLVYAAATGTCL